MLAIQIHDDEGGVTVVPLRNGTIKFGRGDDADVRLTDRNVSRQHARLHCEGDKVWIEDAGARYGTYVNGERLAHDERVPIGPGDVVGIGYFTVDVVTDPAEIAPTEDMPVAATPLPDSGVLELESELSDVIEPTHREDATSDSEEEEDEPVPPLLAPPTPPTASAAALAAAAAEEDAPPPLPPPGAGAAAPEKKGKRKKGDRHRKPADGAPAAAATAPKAAAEPPRTAAAAPAPKPTGAPKRERVEPAPTPPGDEGWYDEDLPEERSSNLSAFVVLLVVLLLGAALVYAYFRFFRPEAQLESSRMRGEPSQPAGVLGPAPNAPAAPARVVTPAPALAPRPDTAAAPAQVLTLPTLAALAAPACFAVGDGAPQPVPAALPAATAGPATEGEPGSAPRDGPGDRVASAGTAAAPPTTATAAPPAAPSPPQAPSSPAPAAAQPLAEAPAAAAAAEPVLPAKTERPRPRPRTPRPALSADELYRAAETALSRNDVRGARRRLEQAAALAPADARVQRKLGALLDVLGDRAGAARHYQRYLELRPEAADADVIRETVRKLR